MALMQARAAEVSITNRIQELPGPLAPQPGLNLHALSLSSEPARSAAHHGSASALSSCLEHVGLLAMSSRARCFDWAM